MLTTQETELSSKVSRKRKRQEKDHEEKSKLSPLWKKQVINACFRYPSRHIAHIISPLNSSCRNDDAVYTNEQLDNLELYVKAVQTLYELKRPDYTSASHFSPNQEIEIIKKQVSTFERRFLSIREEVIHNDRIRMKNKGRVAKFSNGRSVQISLDGGKECRLGNAKWERSWKY